MMTIVNPNILSAITDPVTPKTYIYESPDGGLSVFARELGSTERIIVTQDPKFLDRQKNALRANRLLTILKASETDATLDDALGKLEALYILKYGDDQND